MRPMMSADEPGAEDCIQRTGFVGHASDCAMSGWMSANTVKTAYRIRMAGIIDCSGRLVVMRAWTELLAYSRVGGNIMRDAAEGLAG